MKTSDVFFGTANAISKQLVSFGHSIHNVIYPFNKPLIQHLNTFGVTMGWLYDTYSFMRPHEGAVRNGADNILLTGNSKVNCIKKVKARLIKECEKRGIPLHKVVVSLDLDDTVLIGHILLGRDHWLEAYASRLIKEKSRAYLETHHLASPSLSRVPTSVTTTIKQEATREALSKFAAVYPELSEVLTQFEAQRGALSKQAWDEALKHYMSAHKFIKGKIIQPETIEFIQWAQAQGMTVLAVTARGSEIANETHRQLEECGISFNEGHLKDLTTSLTPFQHDDTGQKMRLLNNGVVFCCGTNKAQALLAAINSGYQLGYGVKPCELVVHVDDKRKYMKQFLSVLAPSVTFIGAEYAAGKQKNVVDLELADLQAFYAFGDHALPDEDARAVLEQRAIKALSGVWHQKAQGWVYGYNQLGFEWSTKAPGVVRIWAKNLKAIKPFKDRLPSLFEAGVLGPYVAESRNTYQTRAWFMTQSAFINILSQINQDELTELMLSDSVLDAIKKSLPAQPEPIKSPQPAITPHRYALRNQMSSKNQDVLKEVSAASGQYGFPPGLSSPVRLRSSCQ